MSLSWNLIVYLSLMSLPFEVPSMGVSPLGLLTTPLSFSPSCFKISCTLNVPWGDVKVASQVPAALADCATTVVAQRTKNKKEIMGSRFITNPPLKTNSEIEAKKQITRSTTTWFTGSGQFERVARVSRP